MACDAVINTSTVGISIGGAVVAYSNDVTITITHEPREITNKDSGGWRDFAEGIRGWEASVSAYYATDGTPNTFFTNISTRATVGVQVLAINASPSDNVQPMAETYDGTAWVNNLEVASPGNEDNLAFTAGLTGCGALTNA